MAVDEHIFGYLALKWKALRSKSRLDSPGLVTLAYLQHRIEMVGGGLLGHPLRVAASTFEERSLRDLLVLPDRIGLFNEPHQNENLYWYRLLVHHGATRLHLYSRLKTSDSLQNRVNEALPVLPRIALYLSSDLPRFDDLKAQVGEDFRMLSGKLQILGECLRGEHLADHRVATEWLKFLPELPLNQLRQEAMPSVPHENSTPALNATGSEIKVKTSTNPKVLSSLRTKDNPLVHVFEKVLTADNFQGGAKTLDGSDESAEHAEALSELTLDSILRSGQDTESFVKSNVVIETSIQVESPARVAAAYRYPEWFHRERGYRQNWCALNDFVHPFSAQALPTIPEVHRQAETLKQRFAQVFNEYRWQTRQKDGPEIDIDALVNWWSQKNASGFQDQRIFCSRKRIERDVALLVLVDGSLSTDSWVANLRLLDQIYQATDILSRALEDFSEKIAFASFSSESRLRCTFGWLKGFEEPWECLRQRLGSLQPQGYTRMGAALRHATSQLLAVPARKRALIIITDAKPTDFDQYEGTHGNEDIRKAVEEALNSDIRFHAIVLSEGIAPTFNRIFGANRYQVAQSAFDISSACLDRFIQTLR